MSTSATLQGIPLTGLRLGAPLGSGRHGVVWAATTAAGERVAVRALPDADPATHAARARRLAVLRGLAHPCLARVLTMPDDTDERLLVSELVTGPALATVRTGRMGLSAPETLALGRDLAEALALLHRHGLVHGDVSPSNVLMVVSGDDDVARPVLVDLVGDLGWEAGTAGFAAPEVRDGTSPRPPSDVWSLAALCAWVTRVGERDEVLRALGAATAERPEQRPSAADLAARLDRISTTPVRVPPASVLAGAALREQAQRAPTVLRPARRRRARHRRTPVTRWMLAGAAAVAALVAGAWTLWPSDAVTPRDAAESVPEGTLVERVSELVALRDEALVAGDAEALAAVTAEDSPAHEQDAQVLAALTTQGTRLADLRTDVSGTEVLTASASQAEVRTVLTQAPHQRLTGTSVDEVPAQPPRCVELELVHERGGWVVETVSDCP